ncbi:MAG: hypothetical protein AAF541_17685, partial [Pseudomonadota bacterium]
MEYENRQNWDLDAWPEMYSKLKELQTMIFLNPPGIELNLMVFTVSSLAAGCRHCQAHGAFGMDKLGVSMEKIQALWSFESSQLFSERERAALRLGLAGGTTPSGVTPEIHADVRAHFEDSEARTLIAVVALGGFMNRYNDTLATVTDAESRDWARTHLSGLGWSIEKHTGEAH